MKLVRFRVTSFRSVEDSGWIEVDNVTAFIGTNESGKTNILLPLWKLNPAKQGAIHPTSDYPRKLYNSIRTQEPKPVFIEAVFDLGADLAQRIADKTGMPVDQVKEAKISRRFQTDPVVDFPNAAPPRSVPNDRILAAINSAQSEISVLPVLKSEEALKTTVQAALAAARDGASPPEIDVALVDDLLQGLATVNTTGAPATGMVVPRFQRLSDELRSIRAELSREHPRDNDAAVQLVIEKLPKFVYYSTYGNLDSEIYLPHVIQNMARKDLGPREEAKVRTLKVLFEFVRLQPKEILELGRDFKDLSNPARQPTEAEIAEIAEKKKQRSILLQSASALLTSKFRAWWKQGEYRFRFEADGDHFRIWVSDDKRPEEIELEGRSTGLQWFLSFYLVFLVESMDAHEDSILLLDEPGISLHPLAQRDLSAFFDGLADTNQLLYTSHSPFLIDADRLDRARKVYVDQDGSSKVTADLRTPSGNSSQRGAGYAVHAALGLTVAESILLGCEPVVVEGPSDQHYLSAIKILLIAAGKLKPGRELVFPPAGGTKGVKAVVSILGGRDEKLPLALLDSDHQGKEAAKSLRSGIYSGSNDLVLEVEKFTGMPDSEIEDLMDPKTLILELDRWQRGSDVPFADEYVSGTAIVPQIEVWAGKHGVTLEKPGWKVELATRVKRRMLNDGVSTVSAPILEMWMKLFEGFQTAN